MDELVATRGSVGLAIVIVLSARRDRLKDHYERG